MIIIIIIMMMMIVKSIKNDLNTKVYYIHLNIIWGKGKVQRKMKKIEKIENVGLSKLQTYVRMETHHALRVFSAKHGVRIFDIVETVLKDFLKSCNGGKTE